MIGNTNAEGLLVADVVLGKDYSSTELKGLFFVGTADTNRIPSELDLGPIPKLKTKLKDTFGRYRNRYWNYILKGESSN